MVENKVKYSAEYISYVANGDSAAVFITRDLIEEIETGGKWVDVIDSYWYDKHGQKEFYYFIVELFPRELRPAYEDWMNDEYKKYITWQTANSDIFSQREQGI